MQKTAYEMRISDWSSDVCSSDLRRRRLAEPARPQDHRVAAAAFFRLLLGRALRRCRQATRRHHAGGPRQLPALEIGRASSREGEWQYVLSRVVAGLLQKQRYRSLHPQKIQHYIETKSYTN